MGVKYRENASKPWREIAMLRGPKGEDGFSPSLSVEQITGGYRLTITDATGSKSIDVMNGEGTGDMTSAVYDPKGKAQDVFAYVDNAVKNAVSTDDIDAAVSEALEEAKASGEFDGKDGYTPVKGVDYFDGEDGEDAVSPTVAVSNITGGHRITITDKNGTKTVDVMNGNDGKDGASATHYWDGTVLVVTSASGSSSADLKGDTGDAGYTPVKGTDYWTDEDRQDIIDEILTCYPEAEVQSF